MDIDGGDLVSGQIQVVARTGSVEKQYDLAGNVVTEVSNGGTGVGIQTQSFTYDARGEMTYTLLRPLDSSHGGVPEYRQYDADGRLIAVSRPLSG